MGIQMKIRSMLNCIQKAYLRVTTDMILVVDQLCVFGVSTLIFSSPWLKMKPPSGRIT